MWMWVQTNNGTKTAHGELSISRIERDSSGTITFKADGHRDTTSKSVPTTHQGQFDFELHEVAQMFRIAVQGSDLPDEYKRVAVVVANELLRHDASSWKTRRHF